MPETEAEQIKTEKVHPIQDTHKGYNTLLVPQGLAAQKYEISHKLSTCCTHCCIRFLLPDFTAGFTCFPSFVCHVMWILHRPNFRALIFRGRGSTSPGYQAISRKSSASTRAETSAISRWSLDLRFWNIFVFFSIGKSSLPTRQDKAYGRSALITSPGRY